MKSNEVVLSRPDIASVVAYRRNGPLDDTEIVLVREFRTPGSVDDGFVRELPSGSSFAGMTDPRSVAVNELREETGLAVDPERLRQHHARQVAATVSTHRAHLFSLELTDPEAERLRSDAAAHGKAADSEHTYVEVVRLTDMMACSRVDWSTLGAVLEALLGVPHAIT
ncbi:NUDIX domain-containing protein [Streptomyces sp. NPDC093510]|uniref:NUDIX domain-containing protein n=1 Tax=Streptomyces sp. NPDC093510 TaxID=3155199 RepID=UPI0034475F1C